MPWGLLGWIVIGGLAGWAASKIMKRDDQAGCLTNIVVGIIGALLGGFLLSFVGLGDRETVIGSFITALLGAVVFLWLLGVMFGNRRGGNTRD
ncbi:MAG TPA: GlsB/YeaQ/YmgE family stress response membrane protein [Actinomycetales bacterium]|nr:GlsB/YeaQ/YmgE family stress response membrane protein [Actinomycetales bacterium]